MRARYMSAEHVGHSGRTFIGMFSSVYSENVPCDVCITPVDSLIFITGSDPVSGVGG